MLTHAAVARVALFLIAAVVTCRALPTADEVTSLPDFIGPLPSRHFSGYLNALPGSFLHYYWVTAQVPDPATAPVIFWTNGGPGCSSMEGFAYELGPFNFKRFNESGPTMTLNPWTWAKLAHLVFVENPPGVGFSYRTDGNYTIDDLTNAKSNLLAVQDLFANKFPEYRNNSFYLSGESYAGIYVPTLAAQILSKGPGWMPQFRGILVGNGVTDHAYDDNFGFSTGEFAAGHGLLSPQQAAAMQAACIPDGTTNSCVAINNEFFELFDVIDFYGYTLPCFNPLGLLPGGTPQDDDGTTTALKEERAILRKKKMYRPRTLRRQHSAAASGLSLTATTGRSRRLMAALDNLTTTAAPDFAPGIGCTDDYVMTRYMRRADVQQALHVRAPALPFALCADIPYISNVPSVVPVYNALLAANKTVLIYNGNIDMVVPYTGTWNWIKYSTSWRVTRDFAAWSYPTDGSDYYGPQVGGFAMQYEGSIWFVLVNGAGHMVPQDRPAAAFDMLQRVLTGRMWPESPSTGWTTQPATTTSSAPALGTSTVAPVAAATGFHAWTAISFVIGLIAGMFIAGVGMYVRLRSASPRAFRPAAPGDLQEPMVVSAQPPGRSVQSID